MQLFDVPRSALKVTFEDVPTPGRLQHIYLPPLQVLEADDDIKHLRHPSLDKWWVGGWVVQQTTKEYTNLVPTVPTWYCRIMP